MIKETRNAFRTLGRKSLGRLRREHDTNMNFMEINCELDSGLQTVVGFCITTAQTFRLANRELVIIYGIETEIVISRSVL
jgi:hypothetical protein